MGTVGIILIVILGLAAVAIAAYLSHVAAQKRREELAALARQTGWRFDPGDDHGHDEEYANFELFRRGHSRRAYNTLTGVLAIDNRAYSCKAGDFTYKITTSNGKTTTTHTYHFSYLILHLPFEGVSDLLIRREGLFDKLAGMLGFDDIDFESAEFSRRFCVKSPDKRFAYDVIHPRMMEFLLAGDSPAVDIEHGRCCLADGQRRWSPGEFQAMMQWSQQFFDLWPDHVTSELDRR